MAGSNLFGNAAWCPIKSGKFLHLLRDCKVVIGTELVGWLVSRSAYYEDTTCILRTLERRMRLVVTN